MEWIKVTERLPENRVYVLTYYKQGSIWGVPKVCEFKHGCFFDGLNKELPTHWTPLPEPPTEQQQI